MMYRGCKSDSIIERRVKLLERRCKSSPSICIIQSVTSSILVPKLRHETLMEFGYLAYPFRARREERGPEVQGSFLLAKA